jgi:hypothetical protein
MFMSPRGSSLHVQGQWHANQYQLPLHPALFSFPGAIAYHSHPQFTNGSATSYPSFLQKNHQQLAVPLVAPPPSLLTWAIASALVVTLWRSLISIPQPGPDFAWRYSRVIPTLPVEHFGVYFFIDQCNEPRRLPSIPAALQRADAEMVLRWMQQYIL